MLGGEPKRPMVQGHGHEGTHGASAAELLVGLDDEGLDPIRDGVKRAQIGVREVRRPTRVLEILEEEEIAGLWCHRASSQERRRKSSLVSSPDPVMRAGF